MLASVSRWFRRLALRGESPLVTIVNYLFAILYVLAIIGPLYYVVVSSFKENIEIFRAPLSVPSSFSLAKYFEAEEKAQLVKAMGLTFLVVGGTEILLLLFGFPAAYAIARIPSRLSELAESFFGLGFLIPTFAVLVPVFLMVARAGLLFNPLALILFYLAQGMPLMVIVLASAMREIPLELEESAIIDGANRLQIMSRVIFPLARAGVVTMVVINFLNVWNEYLFALVLLGKNVRTIQLAVPLLKSERLVDFGLLSAGVVFSLVPVYVMFIIFQEQIVSGLTRGAVKG